MSLSAPPQPVTTQAGLSFFRSPLLANTPLRHAFFTRQGGISSGERASLNGGYTSADQPDNIRENRARAATVLGGDPTQLLFCRQTHSAIVVRAEQIWPASSAPEGDALITTNPDRLIGIVTADCGPILLWAPDIAAVAAIHAGWRGVARGIIPATCRALTTMGAAPASMLAVIGPCIRPENYEVGRDVYDAMLACRPPLVDQCLPGGDGQWRFDLAGAIRHQLRAGGIINIDDLALDTYANPDLFYSHRRNTHQGLGRVGGQMSIIGLGRSGAP